MSWVRPSASVLGHASPHPRERAVWPDRLLTLGLFLWFKNESSLGIAWPRVSCMGVVAPSQTSGFKGQLAVCRVRDSATRGVCVRILPDPLREIGSPFRRQSPHQENGTATPPHLPGLPGDWLYKVLGGSRGLARVFCSFPRVSRRLTRQGGRDEPSGGAQRGRAVPWALCANSLAPAPAL